MMHHSYGTKLYYISYTYVFFLNNHYSHVAAGDYFFICDNNFWEDRGEYFAPIFNCEFDDQIRNLYVRALNKHGQFCWIDHHDVKFHMK